MMTCESGDSSGSGGFEDRNKINELPKQCWCGEKVLLKQSKSENNPNRRYFRCSFAATNLLQSGKHLFKWLDDAMLSEIEVLNFKMAVLEDMLKEVTKEKNEIEKLFERFEEFVLQKVDNAMEESKRKFKSSVIALFGGIFLIGLVSTILFLQ